MVLVAAGIVLFAGVLGWLGWLAVAAQRVREASRGSERAEMLSTLVKLANKDNNQAKLLVEGLKEVTKAYTDSLTKLVIGYQPSESNRDNNTVLDLNSGDNTFQIPTNYVPEHELQDRFMLDDEELDSLKPIPLDGKGGWLE